jgi:hypothetical protein
VLGARAEPAVDVEAAAARISSIALRRNAKNLSGERTRMPHESRIPPERHADSQRKSDWVAVPDDVDPMSTSTPHVLEFYATVIDAADSVKRIPSRRSS